jgi:hypothetical protein
VEEPLPTAPAPGSQRRPSPSDWSRVQGPGPRRPSSFSVGALVGRSFRIWGRHALLFAVVGGLGNVPIALGVYLMYSRMPVMADPGRPEEFFSQFQSMFSGMMRSFVLLWFVSMVVMSLVVAAVCHGASQALRNEPVRPGAMVSAAIHRAPYVLAVVILGMLAALATACTVVGPVFLLVCWCAAIPATVVERVGPIRAFGRSWELSRGHRWQLFAGFAVLTLALAAAGGILQGISTAAILAISGPQSLPPGPALALPSAVYQVFAGTLGTITTVGLAVAHHSLRVAKEGSDPVALARVFE